MNTIITQTLNLNTVDFNIRSFNDASATFRFMNDRLILTGGVTDRNISDDPFSEFNLLGSSAVARDVEALYLIKKDGSLVLRASNKLNNRNFLNITNDASEYVSAIGLVYRKDFDNITELLKFLRGKSRKEEKPTEEKPKEEKPAPLITGATKPKETAVPKK